MSKRFITLVLLFIVLFGAFAATYAPVADSTSTYKPTQIINGDFSSIPWVNYSYNGNTYTSAAGGLKETEGVSPGYNGVDGGWNTTEIKTLNGSLFEVWGDAPNYYVEMNAWYSAAFYQDLHTHENDVIRWSLKHKARQTTETITVKIGAPKMNGNTPVQATGVAEKGGINTNIEKNLAQYEYNGITTGSGIAFANQGDLTNLRITEKSWLPVSGIYTIPEGQNITRFSFEVGPGSASPSIGNFLDDVTFSTLIGNLSAVQNANKSITISGYWGDSDANKKLYLKFNTETQATAVDMSGVLNKNFTITIPKKDIPANATSIDVYHQDYASAKRTIEIIPGYNILMYVGTINKSGGGFSLDPSVKALKTLYEATTSTNTGKVKISALYTEDQSYLINGTDLINDYSLIFVCFPDSFGTNTQTVADNLISYAEQGGCLVMVGEHIGTDGQSAWCKGDSVLSTLSDKMGIDITYGLTLPVGSDEPIIVNKNADLTCVEGSLVEKLDSNAIPRLTLGPGLNTLNNTTIVGTIYGTDTAKNEPVITDTKVNNGYITFLTDINMWMGHEKDWRTNPGWPKDSKNFMKNLLRRSVNNIEAVSNMNKITYAGLDGSHYGSDGGKNTLKNPSKYSSTDTFTLNNPIKKGYEFVGWTGTGLSGFSKSVTVTTGSEGDRIYTANWHKHEFKYVTNGSQIRAYCVADDTYASSCPYHSEEKAITVFSSARGSANIADFVYPVNATNKDLRLVSSNPEYVVTDEFGVVRGIKKTTEPVKVTAYSIDGSNKSYEILVKVVE